METDPPPDPPEQLISDCCAMCGGDEKVQSFVATPTEPRNATIIMLFDIVKMRVEKGDDNILPVYCHMRDFIEKARVSGEILKWHTPCRKMIQLNRDRWEAKKAVLRKPGRPSSEADFEDPSAKRHQRGNFIPVNTPICTFVNTSICTDGTNDDNLFVVRSNNMGQYMMSVKENSRDEAVRVSLSDLLEPKDARSRGTISNYTIFVFLFLYIIINNALS